MYAILYSEDHLFNFRHMPMLGDAIAVDALCDFCVQQILFCTSASTADARLGINDDVFSLDQSCLDQKLNFSYK